MRSVTIEDFKVQMHQWLEEVNKGKSIMITSDGKSIARLSTPEDEREAAKARLKALRKTAKIGDIFSPIGVD